MFENLFKRKTKKDNKKDSKNIIYIGEDIVSKKYQVKDLYVAYPALITKDVKYEFTINYNQNKESLEKIVVVKKDDRFAVNVINEREYGIFKKFTYEELEKNLNQYMVNDLIPLELCLDNTVKSTITTLNIFIQIQRLLNLHLNIKM